MSERKKVAVVGAGIAGLTCAYELQKAGHDVTVYEKNSYVGGRMSSRFQDGYPFDIGADHLCNLYTHMQKYCQDFGIPWQKMAFLKYSLVKNGEIVSFKEAISRFTVFRLAIQYARTKDVGDFFDLNEAARYDTDNARDFMRRRAGQEAVDYLVDPFVSTYQFHRSDEISLGALYGIMQSIKGDDSKSGWHLHRTKGGMIALPEAFASRLNMKLGTPATSVKGGESVLVNGERFDAVVMASTATKTLEVLDNPNEKQRKVLAGTRYASSTSIAFKVPRELLPEISIVWVPYVESNKISGYVNEAMKGEELVHDGESLICVWLHEEYAREMNKKSDDEIYAEVRRELMRVCPWVPDASDIKPHDIERWEEAMPVFAQGHLSRIKDFMADGQGEDNIFMCGDYLNAPWAEGALRCGKRVASQVNDHLSA